MLFVLTAHGKSLALRECGRCRSTRNSSTINSQLQLLSLAKFVSCNEALQLTLTSLRERNFTAAACHISGPFDLPFICFELSVIECSPA